MNKSSYAEVFARDYIGPIFYYCLKKTGDSEAAGDLASDISLAVMSSLGSGPPPEHFSAWVWKIARNRYAKWVDGRVRHRTYISGADIEEFDIADGETPEDSVVEREQYALLRRELAFCKKEYREILTAHYLDGVGISALSSRLEMPAGTVKTRLFKARKILREGMNMAREFGKRSYLPEDISFVASGTQDERYPWPAVERKIPKNILLEANNNPSTAEELAMELGIALPYIEEEIALLEEGTLLKRLDDGRYVTAFFIADKECQLEIYNLKKSAAKECAELLYDAVCENIGRIRHMVNPAVSDNEFMWTLYLYVINDLIDSVPGVGVGGIYKRPNGCDWGFMGFELHDLISEMYFVNHNLCTSTNAEWGQFALTGKGFVGIFADRTSVSLLGELLVSRRKISELGSSEVQVWKDIAKRYAHVSEDGTAAADMTVFADGAHRSVTALIKSHSSGERLYERLCTLFSDISRVLKGSSNPVVHETLNYYATGFMKNLRGMVINRLVEKGALPVPENPQNSNAGMYLIIR